MTKSNILNDELRNINRIAYDPCALVISNLIIEEEGQAYDACKFELNRLKIICRNGKITPKKVGQFVTFWKRNTKGITAAYNEKDPLDFFVINVKKEKRLGQFVFPKSVLTDKAIISSINNKGKRGFRVYPIWDVANNQQAQKTQKWQLKYFVEIDESVDLKKVLKLYSMK